MNSIQAMESEIRFQLEDLPLVKSYKADKNCLFIGSGDSYAACLVAQYASGNRAWSCYPLDLVENPSIADGRVVYAVSVSGKTRANILAIKAAKRRGIHTVAITAKPDSPLASACDEVIGTSYRRAPMITAGTISFAASVITCLSIAINVKFPKSISSLLTVADKQADDVVGAISSARQSYFVLGNGVLFPIALYGAMKLNEVVGAKALTYPTEEFCHSPLFSIDKKDAILVLGDRTSYSRKLVKRLATAGFESTFIQIRDGELLGTVLHSTFFLQMLALKIAKKMKLKECHFVRNKLLLGVSSDFIYD